MKKIILITIAYFFLINTFFGQTHKQDLTLKLVKGIEIKAKALYPDEDISTFDNLKIFQNGKMIYYDHSLTEYTLEDSLYPKLYNFKNHLELLLEIDGRPNKNEIHRFFIKNQKLEKIDTLPTFLTKPKDLDLDKKMEYAGFWDYGQVWGDSIEVTAYNPIVVYEISEDGIILDTLTTINVNEKIYGKFYGFHFNEQIEIPYKKNDKFSKEINRIVNE